MPKQIFINKSFAKINLYLEIIGNDQQGYHLLDSLMTPIDIHDIIKIEEDTDFSLTINGSYSEPLKENSKENIIVKTIHLLTQEYNFTPKIKISLTKNIPIAAGLGGGSSNAASILLMLNKLYKLDLTIAKLTQIGLKLGCDIPFFLHQQLALISGIGDKIAKVKINKEDLYILIVNPGKALSTKKIYQLFKEKYKKSTVWHNNSAINDYDLINIIKNRHNDLEKPAREIIPEITKIISELSRQNNCLIARMSGSGASCFGLFKTQNDLESAKNNIKQKFPTFYIKKSKIIYDIPNPIFT